MSKSFSRWRTEGVRVIRAGELDSNTAQTLGMQRRAAVTSERTGATKLWAGTVTIDANAKTEAHHHGDLKSVICVVEGIARLRWGERLEFLAEARAGDFIHVPPYVPHQEINASEDLQRHCVLARSGPAGPRRQPRHLSRRVTRIHPLDRRSSHTNRAGLQGRAAADLSECSRKHRHGEQGTSQPQAAVVGAWVVSPPSRLDFDGQRCCDATADRACHSRV